MHYAAKVAFSETGLPRIEFDRYEGVLSVDGKKIFLNKLPTFYNTLLEQGNALFAELTEGHGTDLPFLLSDLFDDKVEDIPEFSFIDNRQQNLQTCRFKGLTTFLKKPGFVFMQDGELRWNPVEMQKFLKKAHTLNEMLMVLMHVGGGQPARGQEFFTLTYRNQQNVHRTLFAGFAEVCWIIGYSKVSLFGRPSVKEASF